MHSEQSYYYMLFVGALVFMTHIRGTESFTLGRSLMASSPVSVEDSHETSTAIVRLESKTMEGDFQKSSHLVQRIAHNLTDKSRDVHLATDEVVKKNFPVRSPAVSQKSTGFNLHDDLSSEVEAVVSIQVVKQDLPASIRIVVEKKDNEIHADPSLEYDNNGLSHQDAIQTHNIHYLPAKEIFIPIDQQWHFVKQFITSDDYFGELDEFSREHFLQKMLRGLISQSDQKWGQ